MANRIRIKKEDSVIVISGKYRNLTESHRVLEVIPSRSMILVEGVNMVKRHTKPNPQKNIKGGVLEKEAPMHISNVMVCDPETKKPTRVGIKVLDDGRRVRIAKRSGAQLDK